MATAAPSFGAMMWCDAGTLSVTKAQKSVLT